MKDQTLIFDAVEVLYEQLVAVEWVKIQENPDGVLVSFGDDFQQTSREHLGIIGVVEDEAQNNATLGQVSKDDQFSVRMILRVRDLGLTYPTWELWNRMRVLSRQIHGVIRNSTTGKPNIPDSINLGRGTNPQVGLHTWEIARCRPIITKEANSPIGFCEYTVRCTGRI